MHPFHYYNDFAQVGFLSILLSESVLFWSAPLMKKRFSLLDNMDFSYKLFMLHLEIVIVKEWLRQRCKIFDKDHVLYLFILPNFDNLHMILSKMKKLSSTVFDMTLEMM